MTSEEIASYKENREAMKTWLALHDFNDDADELRCAAGKVMGRAFQMEREPLPNEVFESVDGDGHHVKALFRDGREVVVRYKADEAA